MEITVNYYLLTAIIVLVIMGAFLVYYVTKCMDLEEDLEKAQEDLRRVESSIQILNNRIFNLQSSLAELQIEKSKAVNMSEMFVQAVIMPEDKRTVRLTDVEDKYNELLKKW